VVNFSGVMVEARGMDSFIIQTNVDTHSIARLSTFRRAFVKKAHISQVCMSYPNCRSTNQIYQDQI
jgi:hypothetical protein